MTKKNKGGGWPQPAGPGFGMINLPSNPIPFAIWQWLGQNPRPSPGPAQAKKPPQIAKKRGPEPAGAGFGGSHFFSNHFSSIWRAGRGAGLVGDHDFPQIHLSFSIWRVGFRWSLEKKKRNNAFSKKQSMPFLNLRGGFSSQ